VKKGHRGIYSKKKEGEKGTIGFSKRASSKRRKETFRRRESREIKKNHHPSSKMKRNLKINLSEGGLGEQSEKNTERGGEGIA